MDADRLRISAKPKLIRLCSETNKGVRHVHTLFRRQFSQARSTRFAR